MRFTEHEMVFFDSITKGNEMSGILLRMLQIREEAAGYERGRN